MLDAVNEMKMCGVSPEELSALSRRLGGRGLGKKLSELALVYGTYEALVEASYLDSPGRPDPPGPGPGDQRLF